jgi:1-acyl-sn-glycerol-3-phosphate acyltransferase
MIFIFIYLILAAAYCYLFTLIPLDLWYLFAWVPASLICALITLVLIILIIVGIGCLSKPTKKWKHRLLYQVIQLAFIFSKIKVKVVNKDKVPNVPFGMYGNHKSMLDPLIDYYAMHTVCSAVGKSDLFNVGILRYIAKCFGAVSLDRNNDREAAKSIMQAIKNIKNGLSMIIYPEGGIKTRETELCVDLKPGAYKMATKANAPILPVTNLNTHTIATKKWWKRHVVTVVFHDAIYPEEYNKMTTTELGEKVALVINSAVVNK